MSTETSEYKGYIIFRESRYRKLNGRLSRDQPALKAGEVAMRLEASLPRTLFERPILQAKINIPDSDIPKSILNVEVQNNIAKIVREVLGVEIAFKIVPDKEVQIKGGVKKEIP